MSQNSPKSFHFPFAHPFSGATAVRILQIPQPLNQTLPRQKHRTFEVQVQGWPHSWFITETHSDATHHISRNLFGSERPYTMTLADENGVARAHFHHKSSGVWAFRTHQLQISGQLGPQESEELCKIVQISSLFSRKFRILFKDSPMKWKVSTAPFHPHTYQVKESSRLLAEIKHVWKGLLQHLTPEKTEFTIHPESPLSDQWSPATTFVTLIGLTLLIDTTHHESTPLPQLE